MVCFSEMKTLTECSSFVLLTPKYVCEHQMNAESKSDFLQEGLAVFLQHEVGKILQNRLAVQGDKLLTTDLREKTTKKSLFEVNVQVQAH